MAEKSLLAFFEKLQEISQTMLATREDGNWDKLELLIAARNEMIRNHQDGNYPAPSPVDRQKIRVICENIQHSDKGILEDATEWRDQIRQFILK